MNNFSLCSLDTCALRYKEKHLAVTFVVTVTATLVVTVTVTFVATFVVTFVGY